MRTAVNNKITIGDLLKDAAIFDDSDGTAYGGKLIIGQNNTRCFCWDLKQMQALIKSIIAGLPTGPLYWYADEGGYFSLADGKQRLFTIIKFFNNEFTVKIDNKPFTFHRMQETKSGYAKRFLDYQLLVITCIGTEAEMFEWATASNVQSEPYSEQELRNITYSGRWCREAEKYFCGENCTAIRKMNVTLGNIFPVKSRPQRGDFLEQVILWKAWYDETAEQTKAQSVMKYMAEHCSDENANELIEFFEEMLSWIAGNFEYNPLMQFCDWGYLYRKYKGIALDYTKTNAYIRKLLEYAFSDNLTNPNGIYEYVLSGNIKYLNARTFGDEVKMARWDLQNHKCALCGEEISYEDSYGDHILPFAKGGMTTLDNCEILCCDCETIKADKLTKQAKREMNRLKLKVPKETT